MKKIVAIVSFLLLLCAFAPFALLADNGGITTLIMVRHAEEDRSKEEVPLTDAGKTRAVELARVLQAAKIDAVYSTPTVRTRSTAGPTAEAKGLPIQIYNYKDYTELPVVVEGILEKNRGKTVLLSGHSDDVPIMANLVRKEFSAGKAIPQMGKPIYDNLFVLIVPEKGQPKLLELKYGAPSPAK